MSNGDYDVWRASIQSMFSEDVRYVIPAYQRDYAWEDDDAIRLWDDLSGTDSGSSGSNNLLGAMVLLNKKRMEIVDGQQRLATLSLMFAAIRAYVYRFSDLSDGGLKLTIERTKKELDDLLTAYNEPRVTLGETDRKLFKKIVESTDTNYNAFCKELKKEWGGSKETSHANLIDNYKLLSKKIENWANENNAGVGDNVEGSTAALHRINDLVRNICQHNHFARIQVSSRPLAYKIFKAFNSTGVELDQADLIKSALMERLDCDNKKQTEIKKDWDDVFDGVQKPDRLIYESLSAQHLSGKISPKEKNVTMTNLFDIIANTYNTPKEIEGYISELCKDVTLLKWLDDPDDIREHEALKSSFYGIEYLGARYIRIPILVAYRKWGMDDPRFQDLVECLLVFFFKFRFINEGSIDEIRRISKDVSRMIATEDFSRIISSILVNDKGEKPDWRIDEEMFAERLTNKMYKLSPGPAKYILSTLETGIRKGVNEFEHFRYDFELEHILPVKHQRNWDKDEFFKGYSDENKDIERFKSRLGNLTLLAKKWNRGLSMKSFKDKKNDKNGYAASEFEINQKHLKDYPEWTAVNVIDREKKLLDMAGKAWSLAKYDKYIKKAGFENLVSGNS